jgi:hypothetical protein
VREAPVITVLTFGFFSVQAIASRAVFVPSSSASACQLPHLGHAPLPFLALQLPAQPLVSFQIDT